MGPDLPSRPKVSWDLRSAPWTNARGSQEGYCDAVIQWKAFHDRLPESNSNKIPEDLQGIIFQSQLFKRAIDFCKKVPTATIQSAQDALAIAKAIHKVDPLSTISDTFQKFSTVLHTIRGNTESLRNFESRFEANICSYKSAASGAKLPGALTAFILLSNANLEDTQRVLILSAAAPKPGDVDENEESLLSMMK